MANNLYENMQLLSSYSNQIKSALEGKNSPATGGFSTFATAIANIDTSAGELTLMTGNITCTTVDKTYTITSVHGLTKKPKYMVLYSYKKENCGFFTYLDVDNNYQWHGNSYEVSGSTSNKHCWVRKPISSSGISDVRSVNVSSVTDTSVTFYVGKTMANYMNTGTNGVKFVAIG